MYAVSDRDDDDVDFEPGNESIVDDELEAEVYWQSEGNDDNIAGEQDGIEMEQHQKKLL